MDLGTKRTERGSVDWFLNELEVRDAEHWALLEEAERDGVTDFEAIHTAFLFAVRSGWKLYRSVEFGTENIEHLVKTYVENHATVPYIGRSIKTQEPLACIEAETVDSANGANIYCRFAFWDNGGIYYLHDDVIDDPVYILFISPVEAKIFNYPQYEVKVNQ